MSPACGVVTATSAEPLTELPELEPAVAMTVCVGVPDLGAV